MESNQNDFLEKYELLNSSSTYSSTETKLTTCRYCGRAGEKTTFNQETHLLPELIGNNNVVTFDECDICNNLFSDFESSLSTFVRPYITLLGIKGKKKIPEFQSRTINRDEQTRTILKHKTESTKELHIKSIHDFSIDTENRTVDLIFRKPPFSPLKVYKSLLKIGLSLLPNRYDKFNNLSFEWLTNRLDDLEFIPYVFISFLKEVRFNKPTAHLYRARILFQENEEFPENTLILCFANQIFQIFLPFSDEFKNAHSSQRHLVLTLFPSGTEEVIAYDLSLKTNIIEDQNISLTYEKIEIKNTNL